MASTFTTNFGFEAVSTGDQAGTWGTTTNFNLDILDRIASYKAIALSDASTATLTIREASPAEGTENLQNGMYRVIKYTGTLSQNCTITIAPNTSAAWFIFENATTDAGSSGPYSLIFSQGSGANVTLQNGKNAIVYCDGAGGGAVVTNALSDIQVATLEVTGTSALDGAVTSSAGITTVKEDSGTNTVLNPLIVKRTSSGTPAAGIGTGIEFTTETAAGNNEIGHTIQSVTTDVSSGGEDFDLVINTMVGGATAAEKARLTSAGVWTVDSITSLATNGDLSIAANGTGVPDLEAGFKVNGSAGVPTASIQDNAVTIAKMAGLARGSIISGDSSGDPAALAVGSANTVLQSDGTDASYGTVATAMIADDAVTLAKVADDAIAVAQLSATGTASSTTFLRGDNTWSIAGDNFATSLLHVRDQKADTTAPQTLTSGSWDQRELTTVLTNEITSASLSSDDISLPAGSYWTSCSAPAKDCGAHKLRLQNTTDATTLLVGPNEDDTTNSSTALLFGRFTLSGTKTIQLQHRVATSNPGGAASSFGVVEVYSDVQIWKV
jgi:hypothetical protein